MLLKIISVPKTKSINTASLKKIRFSFGINKVYSIFVTSKLRRTGQRWIYFSRCVVDSIKSSVHIRGKHKSVCLQPEWGIKNFQNP